MSCSLMDSLVECPGLSKWDVYQATGCSCQKLRQEVEGEDKDAGSVYMEG